MEGQHASQRFDNPGLVPMQGIATGMTKSINQDLTRRGVSRHTTIRSD